MNNYSEILNKMRNPIPYESFTHRSTIPEQSVTENPSNLYYNKVLVTNESSQSTFEGIAVGNLNVFRSQYKK